MSGLDNIGGINELRRICRSIRYFRVALKDIERSACKNRCCGVFICGAAPGLNDPVIEYLALRSCRSRAGYDRRVVFIKSGVGRSVAASRSIIYNADTVSADDNLAPLCVKINLFSYPETIYIVIGGCAVAPLIHGIGKIGFFIVRRAASDLLILRENIRAGFILIPAEEFISGSQAFRDRNLSAIGNTEVHCLILRTPVKSAVCAGIGMQEDTILDLTPFCVYSYAALRHSCECVRLCTSYIYIPAFENIAFGSGRCVVVCASFVVGREIRSINDVVYLMKLSAARLIKRIVVTISINTVHEVDRKYFTCVVTINGTCSVPCVSR